MIKAGTQVDIGYIRQALQTDYPLYARLQDYFSRLQAGDLKSVDHTHFVFDDPISQGDIREPPCSVDASLEGGSEMTLASEHDPEAMSMFFGAATSAFAEKSPAVSDQGPFGIRFSDFPPRVISQMLSIQTDVAASSCRYSSHFTWRIYSPLICSLMAWVIQLGRF